MTDYRTHADLLDQVAASDHERNTVRRILGPELQRELRWLPKLTEADLDAHESERMPLPAEAATEIGGADDDQPREPGDVARLLWLVFAFALLPWAAAVAMLIALGVQL